MPKRGFTLIELMVAIAILGIVSTIGLIAYSKSQAIARDSRRKQDLRAIQTALELYYQKNNHYPCVGQAPQTSANGGVWIVDNASGGVGCGGSGGSSPILDTSYINQVPIDPRNTNAAWDDTNQSVTEYYYNNSIAGGNCPTQQGQYYILATHLENINDPDSCKNKQYTRCDSPTSSPWCAATLSPAPTDGQNSLFIITSQ